MKSACGQKRLLRKVAQARVGRRWIGKILAALLVATWPTLVTVGQAGASPSGTTMSGASAFSVTARPASLPAQVAT